MQRISLIKYRFVSLYALATCLVLLASCSKDNTAAPLDRGSFTASIDGQAWVSDIVSTAVYDEVLLNFSVGGSKAAEETTMIIDAVDVTGPGTFELGESDNVATYLDFITEERYETNEVMTGTLRISSMNKGRVKGTFSFDAIDNETGKIIQVRDGKFDVGYLN